jgi:hypothetical protein
VVVVGPGAERRKTTMDLLLPEAFTPSDLGTQP